MSPASISAPAEFAPLPLAGLRCGELPPLNLYLPVPTRDRAPLYRAAGTPVSDTDLKALRSRGIDELWVTGEDRALVAQFLAQNLTAILADETTPPGERLKVLNQVVSNTLKESLSITDPAGSVRATQELARQIVAVGIRTDLSIRDFAKVARHDFCTFTHSANVACFSVVLARHLGIDDIGSLRRIASAGMLHDLGKLEIPMAILTKPGRLTPEEFTIIKLHLTRGFQMLRNELDVGQLMMVYQHHEKMDGRGYPVGCVGEEIHDWAKICAVADVFESLTGNRPYRRANTVQEALTIMARGSGTHFDATVLHCWQRYIVQGLAA